MKTETTSYRRRTPGEWMRRAFTTVAAVMIFGGSSLLACPVCFGAEETSMIDGAKLGVLVMLAVLFVVQGAFVAFFLYLRKRAKRIADIELDVSVAPGAPAEIEKERDEAALYRQGDGQHHQDADLRPLDQ